VTSSPPSDHDRRYSRRAFVGGGLAAIGLALLRPAQAVASLTPSRVSCAIEITPGPEALGLQIILRNHATEPLTVQMMTTALPIDATLVLEGAAHRLRVVPTADEQQPLRSRVLIPRYRYTELPGRSMGEDFHATRLPGRSLLWPQEVVDHPDRFAGLSGKLKVRFALRLAEDEARPESMFENRLDTPHWLRASSSNFGMPRVQAGRGG
jgi:hypothetical protein